MRIALTITCLIFSSLLFSQDNKVHLGLNLSTYLSNQTDLGIGSDFTIGFGRKHQLSLGAKFPFHRIGREKTNLYTENFGIVNASYQYFFWEKPSGIRTFGVLNVEYSFWNYSRDFFYNEGEIVYETLNSFTSYDYSFNAENGIQSKGVNIYAGGGVELPLSNKLYLSGFMAVGTGNYLQKRSFVDLDNSIQLIDYDPISSRSFAFQASLSVGYRFN